MTRVQLTIACVIAITILQTNTQSIASSSNKYHSTHQEHSLHSRNEAREVEKNVVTVLGMLKRFWKVTKESAETGTDVKSSESGSSSGELIDESPSDNDTDQSSYDHSQSFPTSGVFLPPIFDPTVLINSASIVSSECTEGWKDLFNTTDIFGLSSGLKAVDAFGNIGAGFLQDNIHALGLSSGIVTIDAFGKLGADVQAVIYALGSYDECFSLSNTQYCLVNLLVVSDNAIFTPKIKYALCLPRQCSETDIAVSINSTNMQLHFWNLTISNLGGISCESEKKAPYNAGAIIMLIVWSLIALTVHVFGATIFHWVLKQIKNRSVTMKTVTFSKDVTHTGQTKEMCIRKTVIKFILAFSLYKTIPFILSTKQYPHAITSLNGIRVISMFWVILGHTLLWTLHFSNNSLYVLKYEVPKFTFQANISAPFAVDTFFLLSGVLVAYLTLRKMAKLKGKFPVLLYYVHRFLRITPAYAFVLFSYWFLTVHFADGPLWQQTVGVESQFYRNCERYWWTNMLYINNIYPWKVLDECMSWTWYLSNDMQFYIIAPIMVLPLYYLFPVGLAIIGGLLLINIATLGALTGTYDLSGNMYINTNGRTVADDIYTKPWARIGPYLVGLTLGFLLFKQMKPNFRKSINSVIYAFLWMVAIALCLSTTYGLHGSFNGESLSRADDISYQMFSRLAWSIGVAIVIFVCHNGYGWIRDFC